jgi:hypothetical protein
MNMGGYYGIYTAACVDMILTMFQVHFSSMCCQGHGELCFGRLVLSYERETYVLINDGRSTREKRWHAYGLRVCVRGKAATIYPRSGSQSTSTPMAHPAKDHDARFLPHTSFLPTRDSLHSCPSAYLWLLAGRKLPLAKPQGLPCRRSNNVHRCLHEQRHRRSLTWRTEYHPACQQAHH